MRIEIREHNGNRTVILVVSDKVVGMWDARQTFRDVEGLMFATAEDAFNCADDLTLWDWNNSSNESPDEYGKLDMWYDETLKDMKKPFVGIG